MEFSIRLPPLRPVTPSKTARNAAIALAARTGTPITWVGEAGPGGTFSDSAFCQTTVSSGNAPSDVKSGTKSWRKAGTPGR